jgi:hypothetical protein
MDAVPPGGYLALSHPGAGLIPPRTLAETRDAAHRMSQQQYTHRTREEVARFLAGTDLVEPGIVPAGEWRPEPAGAGEAGPSRVWAAVGRKRWAGRVPADAAPRPAGTRRHRRPPEGRSH